MILIIQNGYNETFIGTYLDEEYEIIKSFEVDVSLLELKKYSLIFILGGNQSVRKINEHINLQQIVNLILRCLEEKMPVIGICLGCQLIAYALDCKFGTSKKVNAGYNANVLQFKNILRCHYDYIIPNTGKINTLEIFEDMVYLFNYKNMYGIQCHPDIPPDNIENYKHCPNLKDYADSHKLEINNNNKKIIRYLIVNSKYYD